MARSKKSVSALVGQGLGLFHWKIRPCALGLLTGNNTMIMPLSLIFDNAMWRETPNLRLLCNIVGLGVHVINPDHNVVSMNDPMIRDGHQEPRLWQTPAHLFLTWGFALMSDLVGDITRTEHNPQHSHMKGQGSHGCLATLGQWLYIICGR